jgi:hypothetical protein
MSETFNIDRHVNIENNVDALGKQWQIFHLKGSALYEARPNPYRADTEIPDEFKGRWTKPHLLQEQITKYLNRSWDHAEQAAKKAGANKRAAEQRAATKKKTSKESLDELPEDIKKELGETIATKDD